MRRIKVKRRHEIPLEQRYLELKKENKDLAAEAWDLRAMVITLRREAEDASRDYVEAKSQIQGYRNESIGERVQRQKAEVAYDKLKNAYENALDGMGCVSEEWFDRHLKQTHNVLRVEPFGVEYEE